MINFENIKPETNAGSPSANIGKGCQTFAKGAKNGANRQPTLEIVEQAPTAWLLKLVGYTSEVIKYIIAKAIAEAPFPTKKVTRIAKSWSFGIKAKAKVATPRTKCPKKAKGRLPI